MWQLMGINVAIIMDMGLLGLEAVSLYLLETLLKSVIYTVKLKLEFAILGRLVQFVGRPGTSIFNEERTRQASVAYFGSTGGKEISYDTLPESEASGFVSDFAELARFRTHNTQHSLSKENPDPTFNEDVFSRKQRSRGDSVRLPPGMTLEDVNVAMFQHSDETALPGAQLHVSETASHETPFHIPELDLKYADGAV